MGGDYPVPWGSGADTQRDRDRAVIDQVHLHVGTKRTALHHRVGLARLLKHIVKPAAAFIGRGGSGKPGPVATRGVGGQRELSCRLWFILPAASLKMRNLSIFASILSQMAAVSPRSAHSNTSKPASISPITCPATSTRAQRTRCSSAIMGRPVARAEQFEARPSATKRGG